MNDEQLAQVKNGTATRLDWDITDLLDTITNLKRQLAERSSPAIDALRILYEETADYIRINNLGEVHHNRSMQYARDVLVGDTRTLDAYVQEKVARAVLAESEWWAKVGKWKSWDQEKEGHRRLAANRAKVKS